MLIKFLWTIFALVTFSLGISCMFLMLVFASQHESIFALIALGAGFGGIGFAIYLVESEVLSHG